MRYVFDTSTDPYFNLAAEEYLLTQVEEPVFRLWRNAASVIVGKNQNSLAEIDSQATDLRGWTHLASFQVGDTDNGRYRFYFYLYLSIRIILTAASLAKRKKRSVIGSLTYRFFGAERRYRINRRYNEA